MGNILTFSGLIKKFGLPAGLSMFMKLLINKRVHIRLPEIKHPFEIRNVSSDKFIFYEIFINNGYLLKFNTRVNVIVDAGANIGLFTIQMKALYPDAKIVAIEPDEENFKLLTKNLQQYQDIALEKAGVWFRDTQLDIHDKYPIGKCALQTTENVSEGSIKGVSINTLMKKYTLKRIDILKIDIETSEKELFMANYEEWLPRVKVIIIELHDRLREGCAKTFFEAINKTFVKYTYSIKGASTIIINHNIP